MKNNTFKYTLLFAAFSIFFILAACGNNDSNSADEEKTNDSETKERIVQDANGDVTIPKKLDSIIAPYSEDALLALGITPSYQWAIGESKIEYLQSQLKDVPTIEWNVPIEQVVNAAPDLLIFSAPGAVPDGNLDPYKKATTPFVLSEEDSKDWRKALQTIGKVVNKEEEATNALADYDKKAEEAKATLQQSIGDETVAILWIIGDAYYLVEQDRHSGNVVYGDLGLKAPDFVASLPAAEPTWNPISLEKIAELDADHVILATQEDTTGYKTLQESAVWKGLPAVKNNHVHVMNDTSNWTITGLLANTKTIGETVEALTK